MALHYRGCSNFRSRICAATLSGKTLRIDDIRSDDEVSNNSNLEAKVGLQDFEANFLRLIEVISDGKTFIYQLNFY